jgi:hypothetical protein
MTNTVQSRVSNATREKIDWMLAQAASFARAEDYLGAQARARAALKQVLPGDTSLVADIELALARYGVLAVEWQAQNAARHAAYVARERQAIEAPHCEFAGTPARALHRR